MKLYIEPKMWGVNDGKEELMVPIREPNTIEGKTRYCEELTPEFLDAFIERAKVFEIINFEPQVIADLVVELPSSEDRANAMMERFCVTRSQALLALNIPMCETPLYFFKDEYYRQIERLKTLRRILQEVRDVKDE